MKYKNLQLIEYKEGYSYPIKENIVIDSDSHYNQTLLERDVNLLWKTNKDNEKLIKYALIGGVVLLVVFVIMQLLKGQPVK